MFKENYLIKGKIVCETGLHIGGSNESIEIGGIDNIIIRDNISDLPFIPGSSLKGKMRSLLELNDKESTESVLKNGGDPASAGNCIASKIFGTSSTDNNQEQKWPTRIIVRDSFPSNESTKVWEDKEDIVRGAEVKYENSIDRITSKANPRPNERVPKGSAFDFEIVFSVYEEDETDNLLGVFEAMRLLEDNYLGGAGSRGYGQVKFKDMGLIKRDQSYYKENTDEEVIIENASISEMVDKIK